MGYYIPDSQKWLPLSPPKHLLPLHWECLLCLDILIWNTVCLTSTDAFLLTSLLDRRVLTCFVTDNLACNFEKVLLSLLISTSTYLSLFIFFLNHPLLVRLFHQYCPNEIPDKLKRKLMWQNYFLIFRRLKNV